MPGVAGQATGEHNHRNVMLPEMPLGLADGNPLRMDIEEAADLGGLTFKIDVLVDSQERMVDIYAGDFRKEHRAALPKARQIWMTPVERTDVAVFYAGDTRERSPEGGMFVSITAADLATKPDGIIIHCLSAADGYARGPGMPYNDHLTGRDVLKMRAEEIARDMIFGRGPAAPPRSTSRRGTASIGSASHWSATASTQARRASSASRRPSARSTRRSESALEEKGAGATIAVSFPRGIGWRQMPWREG
jgi:hypothetical protein